MAIRSITIDNLRGIQGLTLKDLPEVVVFGGRNNCGKTTLLEAFLLLAMHYSARPLFELNRCRQISRQTLDVIRQLFAEREGDFVALRGEMNSGEQRTCRYSFQARANYELTTAKEMKPEMAPTVDEIVATFTLKQPHQADAQRQFKAYLKGPEEGRWELEQEKWGSPPVPHVFVPVAALETVDSAFLHEVIKHGEDAALVEALQQVDPRILSVQMDNDRILAKVEGCNHLLPLQALGSGMLHFICIFSAVACNKGGFVCIDEIGNGLHYSACRVLWNVLLPYAHKHHVQLFVTTHREDVLRSFAEACATLKDVPSAAYINLIRAPESGHLEQYRYTPSKLLDALKDGLEVR